MAFTRTKLLTNATYSPTKPASEAAWRGQMDGSIQEAFDMLDSTTPTTSGADYVKVAPITGLLGGVAGTLFAMLSALKTYADSILTQVQAVVLGQIPLGTVTDDRLSNTTGQIKQVVSSHLSDYMRQPFSGKVDVASTATVYTVTLTPTLTAYADGLPITIIPNVDCGDYPTLNISGLGAIPLTNSNAVALTAGAIKANKPYTFVKVGGNLILLSGEINNYIGLMMHFYAIPSSTGKIRLKIEKPLDATGVMIRYKTATWTDGDNKNTGTLVVDITDDTSYKGNNQWYEVSGLTNGTAYYFKAFPYKVNAYTENIGFNETICKAGGLIREYTFDSIAGTTINDTSGSASNATSINAVTYETGTIGNRAKGDGVSARIDIPNSGLDLVNKTITGFFKFNQTSTINDLLTADGSTDFTNGYYSVSAVSNIITIRVKGIGYTTFSDKLTDTNFYCMKHTGNTCKIRRNTESNISVTGDSVASGGSYPLRLFTTRTIDAEWSNGSIDQLRFFNRELEDYEVANIYNGGLGC